jgi:hypothetical protein
MLLPHAPAPTLPAPPQVERYSKRTVKVIWQHVEDCKLLLGLMGVLVLDAPGEEEAQCAAMCAAGAGVAAALPGCSSAFRCPAAWPAPAVHLAARCPRQPASQAPPEPLPPSCPPLQAWCTAWPLRTWTRSPLARRAW